MWKELQRIVSRTEPELGLGSVLKVTSDGYIEVRFVKSGEQRRYSVRNAPLNRFRLRSGQKACLVGGAIMEVQAVHEDAETGLMLYTHATGDFWEYDLFDRVGDHGAIEHFMEGHFSSYKAFDLRRDAHLLRSAGERDGTQGLIGPRVSPLPHQLYIAKEVSRRLLPRVLLSDEVGLGKTIEAGLIFSSLRALGRANRVIIVVPESLIHQWVAEMFRRFNQIFSVVTFDGNENDSQSSGIATFEASQHVIVAMDELNRSRDLLNELLDAPWDLAIIDEAHHLRWDEEEPTSKWQIAKKIADHSAGLLLLTATPQQFGLPTQFGLLHLVDPMRFSDFGEFVHEQSKHREVAQLARDVQEGGVDESVRKRVKKIFHYDRALVASVEDPQCEGDALIKSLIDRHGTGRVLFRNRRERLKGFPKRVLVSQPLDVNDAVKKRLQALRDCDDEMMVMDLATGRWNKRIPQLELVENPKFDWLLRYLNSSQGAKTLVLCGSVDGVLVLAEGLSRSGVRCALFHERLSMLERDQQAAAFGDLAGPNLLICSEIGGEGRNFQFAHRLIFMDLPKHPDLVEQRIGRLDRIGQRKDVMIYVPWLKDTPEETLFRWYDEGLDSFCSSWNGASVIIDEFIDDIFDAMNAFLPGHKDYTQRHQLLENLIKSSKGFAEEIRDESRKSVDLLVDINSFDEELGQKYQEDIEDADDDTSVEFFMKSYFDYYGVDYEDYDDRGTIIIRPENLSFINKIPGISASEETLMTFDREIALKREDMIFLSRDHPIVEESLAMMLDRNEGVASLCKWENAPYGPGMLVEFGVILSANGPKELELGRFLPTEYRSLVFNHQGKALKESRHHEDDAQLVEVNDQEIQLLRGQLQPILEPIVSQCLTKATHWAERLIEQSVSLANKELEAECARLVELSQINPLVTEREISAFATRIEDTCLALRRASPRIDAVRIIFTR